MYNHIFMYLHICKYGYIDVDMYMQIHTDMMIHRKCKMFQKVQDVLKQDMHVTYMQVHNCTYIKIWLYIENARCFENYTFIYKKKCIYICFRIYTIIYTFIGRVLQCNLKVSVKVTCVAGCGRVLQGVAVCCSVLQCVAVCCSVLQCVAV